MAAQTTENNTTVIQDIVENDIFEWEIEEEVVGELIADVFLKGEELEEGPFTLPVDPYPPELVWEFYASYLARQQLLKRRGHTEAFPCLTSVWVQGQEVPAACPLFRPLDKTVQVNSVITLETKIDKEALVMKWAMYTGNITPPSHGYRPTPYSQSAIKKALQPAKDKLASLCSTVDVLESKPTNPCEPEVVPEAPRSPADDWWVGNKSESKLVSDEEPYHSLPPPPPMRSMYDVDISWTPGGVATMSYHELRTLLEN
ncbi:hypothetical protein HAX54_022847 [Datura stramonium]|uniref:Uncharacterized protein n=1 Tax=Datura stramonium TaxID=4076 RepID=A0ABS8UX47_DATST|nr:hypothetical protein [Datura stramonium]